MSLSENMTQVVGIAAFTSVFLVSILAARVFFWRWFAGLFALFILELLFDFRHHFRSSVVDWLLSVQIYQDRFWFQILLLFLWVPFVLATVWVVRSLVRKHSFRFENRHKLAFSAAACIFLLIGIELISLHEISALLYLSIGNIMVIGWIWAALSLVVIIAALPDIRLVRMSHNDHDENKEPV